MCSKVQSIYTVKVRLWVGDQFLQKEKEAHQCKKSYKDLGAGRLQQELKDERRHARG